MADSASLDIVTLIILGLTFDLGNLLSWCIRAHNILIHVFASELTKKQGSIKVICPSVYFVKLSQSNLSNSS